MSTLRQSAQSQEMRELQAWYLKGLRPKIVRAAGSGAVGLSAAAACDRRLCELLSLQEPDSEKAEAAA